MRRVLFVSLCLASLVLPAAAADRRCGWLENPTPANVWLVDPDGT